MERRKLVATAGVLSASAFAATLGLGATFGLFGVTQPDSPIGRLDSRRTVTQVRVEPSSPPSTTVAPAAPGPDDD